MAPQPGDRSPETYGRPHNVTLSPELAAIWHAWRGTQRFYAKRWNAHLRALVQQLAVGDLRKEDIAAISPGYGNTTGQVVAMQVEPVVAQALKRVGIKLVPFLRFAVYRLASDGPRLQLEAEYRKRIGIGDPTLMSEDLLWLILKAPPRDDAVETRILRELRSMQARLELLESTAAAGRLELDLAVEGAKIRFARRMPTVEEIDNAPPWLLAMLAAIANVDGTTPEVRAALKKEYGL